MQAMILAAGFGTRLLPFTKYRPKPLFPVINRPLLLLTVERLKKAGFDHIVVNCHHLKEQIVEALDGVAGVVVQEEDMILGTGGGMRLALRSFRDEPVLVTNGDIYHTIDYRLVYANHRKETASVTMVLHDYPRFNKVPTNKDDVVGFDGEKNQNLLAFTGLQVVNPEILEPIPLNQASSIIDFYSRLLQEKNRIRLQRVDGAFWTDMGTERDYLALHEGLLTKRVPWWSELGLQPTLPFWIDNGWKTANTANMTDWVCAGKVELGRDVSLSRVVLWDGVRVPDGGRLKDALIVK